MNSPRRRDAADQNTGDLSSTLARLPVSLPASSALSQSDIFTTSGFSIPAIQPPAVEFPNSFGAGTSSLLPSSPTAASPRSGSQFFCHTCKKSFATQATYAAHQKTARHVAALKELQRKVLETGSGGERKGKKAGVAVPPAAVEAARKVAYADSLVATDPAKAATVYWSVASELWAHSRIRETAECLTKLIAALTRLQSSSSIPSDAGQSSPSPRPPPTVLLKPSQIVETLFLARIALARLLATYDCDSSLALYVDALAGKYGVPFGEMEDVLETSSLATFFPRTKAHLSTHVKPTFKKKPPPPLKRAPEAADTPHPSGPTHGAAASAAVAETDLRTSVALRKFLMFLREAMSFAVNVEAPREAALLGGMAAVVAAEEQRWAEYVDICVRLADIFQSLDRPWASCDCLELAAGAARSVIPDESVRGGQNAGDDDDDDDEDDADQGRQDLAPTSSSPAGPNSTATSELVLLCDALMIAIYIDDRVRIRRLESRITQLYEREQQVLSPEMHFLLDLARSARVLDHRWKDDISDYAFDGLDWGRFLPTAPRSREKVLSVWRAWSGSELGRAG
ncbi:hypothetical protein HDU88_008932 [Geranomyces variabilis]|nr:hypothetical protein HDU88_008932 [Geranomyces variabilis]